MTKKQRMKEAAEKIYGWLLEDLREYIEEEPEEIQEGLWNMVFETFK